MTNSEEGQDGAQPTISLITVANREDEEELEDLAREQERGWRQRSRDLVVAETDIGADVLGKRLNSLLLAFGESLKATPPSIANFQLAEVTIAIEISASGKVNIMGTGAEVAGKGGLTVKLARPS